MTIESARFRRTIGNFVRSVTLISGRYEGRDHAVTASTFTIVSFPLRRVAVTLHRASRLTSIIQRSGVWGVSLLGGGDAHLAGYFARIGRPFGETPGHFPCRRGPVTGVMLFDDALALLECRTIAELDADDHLIFLGEPVWLADRDTGEAPLCEFRGTLCDVAGAGRLEVRP